MVDFLIAPALIFLILCGWLLVQHTARLFAWRHPELGSAKEEGGGCDGNICQNCGEKSKCNSHMKE
jgi:hypothetical protein